MIKSEEKCNSYSSDQCLPLGFTARLSDHKFKVEIEYSDFSNMTEDIFNTLQVKGHTGKDLHMRKERRKLKEWQRGTLSLIEFSKVRAGNEE